MKGERRWFGIVPKEFVSCFVLHKSLVTPSERDISERNGTMFDEKFSD